MNNYDVYGIGNALVDTEYEVDDAFLKLAGFPKGIMTLIEEEERQRLTHLLEYEHECLAVKRAGGGSAANTMVAISQLGGRAFYSCKVAADAPGDFFLDNLRAAGIDTNIDEEREEGATGQCISMVTPDAERTMTTCLGITNFLSPDELNPAALKQSSRLYIEGYLVSSATGFQAALEAQATAHANGVEVSLTLSDPEMVANFKANYGRLLDGGVDLLFCNHDEAKLLTGADSIDDCVLRLRDICRTFVLTRGKEGSVAFDGVSLTSASAVPAKAVDTTGAGDIFAGAFLYGLCRSKSYAEASEAANRSASLLIQRFGARLTQAEVDAALK